MTWMLGYQGEKIDLVEPENTTIYPETIGRVLGRLERFGGHTRRPWSVLEHSFLVAFIAGRILPDAGDDFLVAALCHDAHEAYVGDMPSPMKPLIAGWREFEKRWEAHVREALEVAHVFADRKLAGVIKHADIVALRIERKFLLHPHPDWVVEDQAEAAVSAFHALAGLSELPRAFARMVGGPVRPNARKTIRAACEGL